MKIKAKLSFLLLAIVSALPAAAIEPVSKCKALEIWAAGLEKLPADYASFTALESGERSAVYARLSHSQRAALWHEQMSRELAQDGWTEAQRTLIAESRAWTTADNLAAMELGIGTAFEAAQSAFASLDARLPEAFSREETARVFSNLGPAAGSRTRSSFSGLCHCSETVLDNCRLDEYCVHQGSCQMARCGPMWLQWCDSICCPNQNPC